MKKTLLTLLVCLATTFSFAGNLLTEGFEYANHDFEKPVGWNCDDNSWLCGYLEKDHNRLPHTGNWYAFCNAEESWMYMPLYFIESIRYRFTLWAISDGEFQFEIWAGSAPNPDDMHTLFYSTSINNNEYDKVSAYIETIPSGCQYFGFRAVAINGASHLTIDDVEIDQVEQYTFTAEEITRDTAMYPGTEATFHYLVHNTGYDAVDVTMHPSNEYFTDFTCTCNGVTGMTVPTEPDETVEVTMTATLRPEVQPGTIAWLDIQMTIPCNCNTAMVTFWVTPLDPDGIVENDSSEINVFPNPATDFVMIETEGFERVMVMDLTGRVVEEVQTNRIDLSSLTKGLYVLSVETNNGFIKKTFVKR